MNGPAPRDRLIVALDTPTLEQARKLVDRLGNSVTFYKIGLELVMQGGIDFARELKEQGKQVFLDMKLLDIGHTVERAVANAAAIGADLLTIHATDSKTMKAAVAGRQGGTPAILAVTVLTNLDAKDIAEQGATEPIAELVRRRARLANAAGCNGVVSSGQEAAAIRRDNPSPFLIVTPGIRLPTDDAGDQSRITTPQDAIRSGADYLVVGRPITASSNPKAAAELFVEHIATACR